MEPYSLLIVLTIVPVILDTFGLLASLIASSAPNETARIDHGDPQSSGWLA